MKRTQKLVTWGIVILVVLVVLLMLVSILLNYFCGLAAARQQSRQRSTRGVLVLGVC